MQPDNQKLQQKLHALWRRERRLLHARGICHIVLWIVGLILIDLALDWLLDLPGWARVLLVLANLAALVWVGYHRWWRFLRPFDSLRASLAVERLHPELNSLLVSYVQFEDADAASPQMMAALRKQAVQTAGPLDFLRVVNFRQLRNLALAATVVLVAFEVSSFFMGDFYRVLAMRLFNPMSEVGYPTRTHIAEVTGDLTLKQGDPADLIVEVSEDGEVPNTATLQISYDDGPWERVTVVSEEQGHFAYQIGKSTNSFVYRYRVGDARSKQYEVNVVPSPQIVESTVSLQFPDYTALDPQELESLNFEILEGTTVEWQIRCDQALTSAQLACDPGQTIDMTIDPSDPHLARATMKAKESLAYQFRWTEQQHGYNFEDSVRYSLRVTMDEPPQVEILPPLPATLAGLKKTLNLRFRARDEYGLGEAWIVYSVNGEAEYEHALGALSERTDELEIDWKPAEWISNLAENDMLTFAIKVTDNHRGERGPNAGQSQGLSIRFLGREDYLRAMMEAKNELFSRVKGVQEDESESSNTLKTLRTEAKP